MSFFTRNSSLFTSFIVRIFSILAKTSTKFLKLYLLFKTSVILSSMLCASSIMIFCKLHKIEFSFSKSEKSKLWFIITKSLKSIDFLAFSRNS